MRLCKRGEEKRCLKIWVARYMHFLNMQSERMSIRWVMVCFNGVRWVVAWSFLYKAKYVTRFELVKRENQQIRKSLWQSK